MSDSADKTPLSREGLTREIDTAINWYGRYSLHSPERARRIVGGEDRNHESLESD